MHLSNKYRPYIIYVIIFIFDAGMMNKNTNEENVKIIHGNLNLNKILLKALLKKPKKMLHKILN